MRGLAVLLLALVPVCAAFADEAGPVTVPPGIAVTVRSRAVGRTHDCQPFYPRASLIAGETGAVGFRYGVEVDGTIGNVLMVHSSGFARLDDAALQCVTQQWRDTPAMAGTTPVATTGHLGLITFSLSTSEDAIGFLIKGVGRALTAKTAADLLAAIGDFDKALEIDSNYRNAYYERGMAYRRLGDTARAEADFAKAGHEPVGGEAQPPILPPPRIDTPASASR